MSSHRNERINEAVTNMLLENAFRNSPANRIVAIQGMILAWMLNETFKSNVTEEELWVEAAREEIAKLQARWAI